MDELESRLEHDLSGLGRVPLAEPVPVGDLERRARRVRSGRAITGIVAVTAAVALVGAVAVAVNNNSTDTGPRELRVAAPAFALGDIDAVVLSSTFDQDGARNPFATTVVPIVAGVPGVQRVSGVVNTFAPPAADTSERAYEPAPGGQLRTPPRTPILFSYHAGDRLDLVTGRLPGATDEIIVDADLLSRYRLAVGDTASFDVRDQHVAFRIVGTFILPGVDLTGIPLAALAAAHQPPQLALDRLDVKLAPGADAANVRQAIATAVGIGFAVEPPSAISIPDQRLAQLEIQHAYWSLLSPDPKERGNAVDGPPDPNGNAIYEERATEAANAELRVEDVRFLSPDAATLTYRVFFGGSPSPIVHEPQHGAAVRVKGTWKLTSMTVCELAKANGRVPCPPGAESPSANGKPTIAPPAATSP